MPRALQTCGLVSLILFLHQPVDGRIPTYQDTSIFARTGLTSWKLPDGSSIASATASLNDLRDVVIDVNFVGNTGNPGLFFGAWNDGQPQGGIAVNVSDTILGDPIVDENRRAAYTVGLGADPSVYDGGLMSSSPINYPLGVTGSSNLQLAGGQLAGRLELGFTGDVFGTFPQQSSGFPPVTVYAADRGVDVASPYSFLYTPDASQHGGVGNAPRLAAKVSAVAGFDFEAIRLFEADGSSTLIATETETDPTSPFSEFITNSVAISDDGKHVAFQATNVSGTSGIYRYTEPGSTIDLIAEVGSGPVGTIDIFAPGVNNSGLVVFRGDDDQGRSSIFVGDGADVLRVAGEGDELMTDIGNRQLGRRDMDHSQSGAPRINNRGDISFAFQYFDADRPTSIADGTLVLLRPALPLGDFDGDGVYTCADIDPLIAAIADGNDPPSFDLTGDGRVDLADRDAWLAEAGAAQLIGGRPYLLGDADLDGVVDGSDFNAWNENKFLPRAAWCAGDFTADGNVDGSDFNLWNAHKFQAADGAGIVPEPVGILVGACGLWLMCRRRMATHRIRTWQS